MQKVLIKRLLDSAELSNLLCNSCRCWSNIANALLIPEQTQASIRKGFGQLHKAYARIEVSEGFFLVFKIQWKSKRGGYAKN